MNWVKAIIVLCAGYLAWSYMPETEHMRTFFGVIAGVSATLLGFIIAALSILTAVLGRRFISNLKKTGHYDTLIDELLRAAFAFLASLIVSLVSILVNNFYVCYAFVTVVVVTTLAIVLFVSSGRKFYLVIRYLSNI